MPAGRYARPHRVPASLEVKSLSVRYGGVQALDEVSFRVEPGEVVGLIGPNGAGKTTLLDAVTGFTKPSAGTVLLNGRKIVGWSPVRINRAGVSRSFQAVQLFDSMTVRENLLTAIDSDSWIPYVTDLVHPERPLDTMLLDEIVHEFELANLLDRRPSELPHGTARLVGVARALLCDPAVLFLDEPAAGLDASESAELVPLIRRIAAERQVAVVLVEHDVPLVLKTCDRIVVLDFGREIAHGSPEEIRRDPAVIAAYLGADHDEEAQPVSVAETVPPIQA